MLFSVAALCLGESISQVRILLFTTTKNRSPAHAPQLTYYIKSSQFFSAVFQVSLLSQLKKKPACALVP